MLWFVVGIPDKTYAYNNLHYMIDPCENMLQELYFLTHKYIKEKYHLKCQLYGT